MEFKTADLYDANAGAVQVAFAWVKFNPGEWLYADRDGVLACANKLL